MLACNPSKTSQKKGGKGGDDGKFTKTKQKIDYFFVEGVTKQMQGDYKEAIGLFSQVLEISPENHAAKYNLAKCAFQAGDLELAEKYATDAVKDDDTNYWYYALLSDIYNKTLAFNKAIETNEAIIAKFPEHLETWFNLSVLYNQSNKVEDAIRTLDDLEAQHGINEEGSFRKHQYYLLQNKPKEALGEIDNLLVINPYNVEYLQMKYDLQLLVDDTEGSLKTLEDILEINPGNGFALLSLADHYKTKGEFGKSDEYLYDAFKNPSIGLEGKVQIIAGMFHFAQTNDEMKSRLAELTTILEEVHPESAEVYGIKGDLALQAKDEKAARDYYRKSLKINPTSESVWQELLILGASDTEYSQLKKDAEKALEYFPDQIFFLYFYGLASSQQKENDEAIFAFERIKKIGTTNLELLGQAYFQLGEIYHDEKDFNNADKNFDLALEMSPSDPLILNNYAYYLSLRDERLEDAEKMVLVAIEKEPTSSAYQDTYGWILYKLNNFEKAEEWIAKSIENGGSGEVLEHYGDVWLKLGNKEKALEFWKKAKVEGQANPELDKKINSGGLNE